MGFSVSVKLCFSLVKDDSVIHTLRSILLLSFLLVIVNSLILFLKLFLFFLLNRTVMIVSKCEEIRFCWFSNWRSLRFKWSLFLRKLWRFFSSVRFWLWFGFSSSRNSWFWMPWVWLSQSNLSWILIDVIFKIHSLSTFQTIYLLWHCRNTYRFSPQNRIQRNILTLLFLSHLNRLLHYLLRISLKMREYVLLHILNIIIRRHQ